MYQCGQRMNNFIECYPQVLSQEQCNNIIDAFNKDPNRLQGLNGGRIDITRKDSIDVYLSFKNNTCKYYNDIIHHALMKGIHSYMNEYEFIKDLTQLEVFHAYNVQYYGEGQGYKKLHCEHENLGNAMYRILAWMFYLNDAQCGTTFPMQDITLKPSTGDLWVWPAFWTHAHKGVTPNIGDKYIATGWVQFVN